MTPTPTTMTDAQIKHMVNRFLAWKLPETFGPDGGIKFERVGNVGTSYEFRREPVGTNLLTATEAEAMVKHMLEGLPPAAAPDDLRELREAAERATPGPWHVEQKKFHGDYSVAWKPELKICRTYGNSLAAQHDATYIALANPSTVLSLIDRITRLESENARLREAVADGE